MKKILAKALLILIAAIASAPGSTAQIIDYTNATAGTLSTVATNATGSALTRVNGATVPGTPCASGFSSTTFPATTVYVSTLPAVQATASANSGYTLDVTGFSADIRMSPTGPDSARYAYSIDGGTTWTDQGFSHAPNNAGCGTMTTYTWTTPVTVPYPGSIMFRIYAFHASGTTGTFQVMNLLINGTVTTASSSCGTPATLSATAVTTTTATLNWSAVTGATLYNIRYRIVGTTTWSTTTATGLSVALTGLTPCSNYEFQVQAVCPSGTGSFTASTTFTTSSTSCGSASGLAASAITATSATLSWTAVSGATSYNIQYRPLGTSTWSTTTSTSASVSITGLASCTVYEFEVQTVCACGSSAYTASTTFTTLSGGCGTVTGLSSTGITTTAATVSWTAISGATSYNIEYKPTASGTWSTTTSTTTSVALTGLTAGTAYEFQVQAVCPCGSGVYSAPAFFTTLTVVASTGSKIKVYFNTPVNTAVSTGVNAVYLNSCMADTIVAYINRARYSIDIAQYDYNQSSSFANIATAVNNAYLAGKTVRWIYDGSQPNTGIALLNPGIHTLASPTTSAYGIMHNKFVIIDANSTSPTDAIVCTGSEDWGSTQFINDNNNLVFIQDSSLAHAYTNEFNMMWGSTTATPNAALAKFGPYKTDLGAHTFYIGGNLVELYFSPSDGTDTHIQSSINSANTDLYFGVYDFTMTGDATDIVSRHTAGVYTAGIVDQYSSTSSAYPILTSGLGTLMKTYTSSSYIYHNKMLIVDPSNTCSDPQVLTGSHNWTSSANTLNDENTLIIHNDTIANIYYQSFYANYTALSGTLSAIAPCSSSTCGVPSTPSAISITGTSATLIWVAVSGATSYNVQYRKVGTSTWTTVVATSTTTTITGLTTATTYEFQVQAVCSAGSSSYTTSATFTTISTAAVGSLAAVGNITLIPNPTSGPARLTYSLTAASQVTIGIYDLAGRLVQQTTDHEAQQAGEHGCDINLPAPGMYLVKCNIGTSTVILKAVKL